LRRGKRGGDALKVEKKIKGQVAFQSTPLLSAAGFSACGGYSSPHLRGGGGGGDFNLELHPPHFSLS
jgi:hypothetical protein